MPEHKPVQATAGCDRIDTALAIIKVVSRISHFAILHNVQRLHKLEHSCFVASFPGLPHLQLLIASSMQKRMGKAWGIFSHDTRHDRHHRHASYQQSKTCTRPILHSALATKMAQAPTESYTERMKHTQATRHDSKGLPSDKRENAQLW